MYTDAEIKDLIECPKIVVDGPKEGKEARAGYSKKTFTMRSIDGKYEFSGFINQNDTFPENFSIGLVHFTKGEMGKVVLLRCNGPHGPNSGIPHHDGCHIHTSTAERINSGLRAEGEVEMTQDYITIEEAIQFYAKRINIEVEDRRKHFPPPNVQINLFE